MRRVRVGRAPQHAVPGGAGPGGCQGHHGEGAGGGAALPQGVPGGLHVRAHRGQGSAGRSGHRARGLSCQGRAGAGGSGGEISGARSQEKYVRDRHVLGFIGEIVLLPCKKTAAKIKCSFVQMLALVFISKPTNMCRP